MAQTLPGPIGLFDSGLGGLTVLRELQRTVPDQTFVYLGDNARFPYGTKSTETIIRYSKECADFLLRQEVKILIVACNTASAAALSILERELSIPVIGTVKPAVHEALARTKTGRVGVLGTNATVASNVYDQAIHDKDASVKVFSQACPLFVPVVEAGMLEGEIVEKITELYLNPIKAQGVDTVILGCTHYPLLHDVIQRYLGDEVAVVECSRAIAANVLTLLNGQPPTGDSSRTRYFVTDEASRFNYLASSFLGGQQVEAVRIESL